MMENGPDSVSDFAEQSFSACDNAMSTRDSKYNAVRSMAHSLAASLSAEDQMVRPCAVASPMKWQQAHTAGFFETFVLRMSSLRRHGLGAKLLCLKWRSFQSLAPLPLRLIVGFGFMEHGYAKLVKGPEAFAAILHALNVPASHLMAWLTILTELLGGAAVLLGAFIPLVSVPMAAVLLVAMISVHWHYGFSSIKLVAVTPEGAKFGPPGYECDLLYLACLVALVLGGSGPLSVDRLFSRSAK